MTKGMLDRLDRTRSWRTSWPRTRTAPDATSTSRSLQLAAAEAEPLVEGVEAVRLVGEDQHAPAGDVIAALRSRSARDEPRGNDLHLIWPTTNPG
jgi:hypothetical protein